MYPSYFSRSDDRLIQDDDEQMVGGGRENDRGGTKRPSDDFEVYKNTEDPPRKNRPAGYGGTKDDTPTDKLAKTYSLNNLIATNGLIKKNADFDLLLSQMANISMEDLDEIRKKLIGDKKTQHLTGTMTANNGRQIKRPAPEILISTLFYVVACSLVSWEAGKEITHHRLTL